MSLEITSNGAQVAIRYHEAPKLIAKSVVKIMRTIGATLVSYAGREKLSGQVLGVRTGNTRRALFYRIFVDAAERDVVLVFGADTRKAPGAAANEYGATIVPKTSTFLTVPLDPALTGKGVARVSAREFIANPQSLGFESSFVNRRKTAILGVRDGGPGGFDDDSDREVVPVFALVKRVVLPERSFLRSSVRDKRAWIGEQLGITVQEAARTAADAADGGPVAIGSVE